jgi:RNA polymerase sigma factor (sigma-70 family)
MEMSETELLHAFVENQSEAAFAQLVRRYAGLVYTVAKRRLANASLAEDITQLVFIRLAKTPPKVRSHAELAAWLHRTTANVTIDTWRSETRRRHREQQATAMEPAKPENALWEELAPSLDDALNQLNDEDRQALLLRFFGRKPMRDVGAALGVGEDAAKMRVSRALDRLRTQLGVGGVGCTAALLGTLLTERSVEAIPVQLSSKLAALTLSGAIGAAAGPGAAFLKVAKFNFALGVVALAVMGVGAVRLIQSLKASPAQAVTGNSTGVSIVPAPKIESREQTGPGGLDPALAPPVDNTNAAEETFTGGVIDKFSRAPVAGAIVHVRREISSATEHRTVEETEHVTDADGRFQFSLGPDLRTNRATYLNFEVTHSNYARLPWNGYALAMMRKNLTLGAQPFFDQLELTPGQSISGALVRPDGAPAADVKILTYSKTSKSDMAEYGSFAEARTDASGRFNVNVVKDGEAVLWLLPRDWAPSTHLLHQQRGDLGQFKLEEGTPITGQVLASDGTPVNSVWVNAELTGGPAKQPIGMPVVDALSRSALTDERGSTG